MRELNLMWRPVLLLIAGLFASGALMAAGQQFNEADFNAAQHAGKPVLVAVHADWCPTCRAQEQVLRELLKARQYAGITVFRVDFDSQKPALRRFGAKSQSTLILFRGKTEVARSIGQTGKDAISADLAKLL